MSAGANVIVFAILSTQISSEAAAALKIEFPGCAASTWQRPPNRAVTWPLVTEQIVGVALVNVTARLEVAVAARVTGPEPIAGLEMEPNAMLCSPLPVT